MSLTCVTLYLTSQTVPPLNTRFLKYNIHPAVTRCQKLAVPSADCLWILRGTNTELPKLIYAKMCAAMGRLLCIAGFHRAVAQAAALWKSNEAAVGKFSPQVVLSLLQADTNLSGPEAVQSHLPSREYSHMPTIHCVTSMLTATSWSSLCSYTCSKNSSNPSQPESTLSAWLKSFLPELLLHEKQAIVLRNLGCFSFVCYNIPKLSTTPLPDPLVIFSTTFLPLSLTW